MGFSKFAINLYHKKPAHIIAYLEMKISDHIFGYIGTMTKIAK